MPLFRNEFWPAVYHGKSCLELRIIHGRTGAFNSVFVDCDMEARLRPHSWRIYTRSVGCRAMVNGHPRQISLAHAVLGVKGHERLHQRTLWKDQNRNNYMRENLISAPQEAYHRERRALPPI
jgi:hypothetical protein